MQPKRLSILGVGLLGGSLGLAVKKAVSGCHVVGYAHRKATLDAALERSAIDEGYADAASAVRGADLVVLCTPVGNLRETLIAIAPVLESGAIVTDVGSTKAAIVAAAENDYPNLRFVGSHPMAGSEKKGVAHASVDLYRDAVCITTPTAKTDPAALAQVEAFWRLLGMRIKRLAPEEHDRAVCDVSHLPHAVAAALVTMQTDAALPLAGKGFLDATRIAGGDGGLWRDILLENRANLVDSIARLRSSLDALQELLDPAKSQDLCAWLDQAASRRARLGERRERAADE